MALATDVRPRPRLCATHVLLYLGGLLIIGSLTWYLTKAWDDINPWALLLFSLASGMALALGGLALWRKGEWAVAGGMLMTAAVCTTPLVVYSFESIMGWWLGGWPGTYSDFHRLIRGGWLHMEIATLVAGGIALRHVRFPFLTMPLAVALWYVSMDLAPLILGEGLDRQGRYGVSMVCGLGILAMAWMTDVKWDKAFAFWGYLFGLLAFWGGLTLFDSSGEWSRFLYCLANIGLMAVSLLLRRRVFLVFGGLGVVGYLGHLAYRVFEDSLMFSLALCVVGLAVMALGMQYQRNEARIAAWATGAIPERMRRVFPGLSDM